MTSWPVLGKREFEVNALGCTVLREVNGRSRQAIPTRFEPQAREPVGAQRAHGTRYFDSPFYCKGHLADSPTGISRVDYRRQVE